MDFLRPNLLGGHPCSFFLGNWFRIDDIYERMGFLRSLFWLGGFCFCRRSIGAHRAPQWRVELAAPLGRGKRERSQSSFAWWGGTQVIIL